jgi:Family of unknown function (DUF6526)
MAHEPQSFKNHAQFDPAFHFFLSPVAFLLFIGTIVNLVRNPGWWSGALVLVAIWAIVAMFKIRVYALKVQDRVIRLEERIRLKELLPPPLQARIPELTEDQLIALRFASDGELPGLVEKILAGGWNRKQIKEAVQNWRPDYWRV